MAKTDRAVRPYGQTLSRDCRHTNTLSNFLTTAEAFARLPHTCLIRKVRLLGVNSNVHTNGTVRWRLPAADAPFLTYLGPPPKPPLALEPLLNLPPGRRRPPWLVGGDIQLRPLGPRGPVVCSASPPLQAGSHPISQPRRRLWCVSHTLA